MIRLTEHLNESRIELCFIFGILGKKEKEKRKRKNKEKEKSDEKRKKETLLQILICNRDMPGNVLCSSFGNWLLTAL